MPVYVKKNYSFISKLCRGADTQQQNATLRSRVQGLLTKYMYSQFSRCLYIQCSEAFNFNQHICFVLLFFYFYISNELFLYSICF